MGWYAFTFDAVRAGDPEAPEECADVAEVVGLSCGESAGEAWERLREYCSERFLTRYKIEQKRFVERFRRGEGRVPPPVLQWGFIIPARPQYRAVSEATLETPYRISVPSELCESGSRRLVGAN